MKNRFPLRLTASSLLAWWLAALVVCAIEPLVGHTHSEFELAAGHFHHQPTDSHHRHGHHHHHHSEEGDDSGQLDPFCSSACAAAHPGKSSVTKPDFGSLFFRALPPHAALPAPAPTQPLLPRQPPDHDRLLTPVVCLDPALRSLAPPTFPA